MDTTWLRNSYCLNVRPTICRPKVEYTASRSPDTRGKNSSLNSVRVFPKYNVVTWLEILVLLWNQISNPTFFGAINPATGMSKPASTAVSRAALREWERLRMDVIDILSWWHPAVRPPIMKMYNLDQWPPCFTHWGERNGISINQTVDAIIIDSYINSLVPVMCVLLREAHGGLACWQAALTQNLARWNLGRRYETGEWWQW